MSASLTLAVPSGPFIDLATGNVTPAWRQFLVTLAARTGGSQGMPTPDGGALQADIDAANAARAAGDVALTTGIAGERTARQAADADLAFAINQRVKLSGDRMTGQLMLQRVGFNGTLPILRPTVTGSKAANAALTSLMTALVAYGLVTDSTT